MSEPFVGEIRIMSFGYAPKGWALANGQLMPISQNQVLFALLGTTYGGDGRTTFALPDLQARVPMHRGAGFEQGQAGGESAHTLAVTEIPAHNHTVAASTAASGGSVNPSGRFLGGGNNVYWPPPSVSPPKPPAMTTLQPETVQNAGTSQPHENMQPFLVLNFCIALQGIFPSQS